MSLTTSLVRRVTTDGRCSHLASGMRRVGVTLTLVVSVLTGAGCASLASPSASSTPTHASGPEAKQSAVDPWERFNRRVFAFNDAVDEAVLSPIARVYRDAVPEPVRTGIGNVFSNVGDLWSAANHLLQGKLQPGVEMSMRFLINTTMGLGGVLDVASEMRLTREREDFGQTLGRWGMAPGPYLVLPFLGPSSVRETLALPLDRRASLPAFIDDTGLRNALTALGIVQARSELLSASRLLDQVAMDRYTFVRDSFLARRRNLVWDGNPPAEPVDDDPDDDHGSDDRNGKK